MLIFPIQDHFKLQQLNIMILFTSSSLQNSIANIPRETYI
jgi:hypothetical protein